MIHRTRDCKHRLNATDAGKNNQTLLEELVPKLYKQQYRHVIQIHIQIKHLYSGTSLG